MRPSLARALRLVPVAAGAVLILAGVQPAATQAAPVDASITVPATPATHVATYQGHAPFNNDQDGLVYGQLGLDDPKNACGLSNHTLNDQHTISVTVPPVIDSKYDTLLQFAIHWTPLVNEPTADMALYLYGPDGKLIDASDGSQTEELVSLTLPKPGVYTALVCAFQDPPQGQDYTGTITATTLLPAKLPKATNVVAPTYNQLEPPGLSDESSGEPSIGNSWKTGATFFTAGTTEYKVDFDDAKKTATWKVVNNDVSGTTANTITLDPIGFTDSSTGRTFVSQLLFATSGAVFTDNDFASVTPSEGGGTGINGFDHQTIGAGPYPAGMHGTGSYPHAVYYCSQSQALFLGAAACSRSDNGGLTFGSPVQTYNGECSGLHGHIRVAPDGTAYLPNASCGDGHQGVVVSTDAGRTWHVRVIPDSFAGQSDPSVAAGSDGTVYYGYSDGSGAARIAVSRDRGLTWSKSVDVGQAFGIHNSEFAEVIAGDGDRAAYAFLGTPTRGSTQSADFGKSADGKTFTGATWHLYVATTYDRGAHWTVVDGTPKDPVQRGCIWNGGGSNQCRNLLDFNDITIDKQGRVMVAFADGCINGATTLDSTVRSCVTNPAVNQNGYTAKEGILRQQSGKGLFAAYDGVLPGSKTPVKQPTKKPTKKPAKKPTKPTQGTGGTGVTPPSGSLAATGGNAMLPIVGGVLIALGLGSGPLARGARRRLRRRRPA